MEAEETTLSSKVPPGRAGVTLLQYLSGRFKYQNVEQWKEHILRGRVKVNGQPTVPDAKLARWDEVSYTTRLREPRVDRGIRILHEEESFLVAFKPGQLPCHSDSHYLRHTFIHLLSKTLKSNGFGGRAALCHRLDRETSGLMVVAKTKEAHRTLARQFEEGEVGKEYLAVGRGVAEKDLYEVSGRLERDPDSRVSVRRRLVPGDGDSFTRFEVLERLAGYTLFKCLPRTGRTHQLRVHLAHLGFPVAGDKLYGRTDAEHLEYLHFVKTGGDPSWDGRLEAPRQMLHASRLTFRHPTTNASLDFSEPPPPDLTAFLEAHRI